MPDPWQGLKYDGLQVDNATGLTSPVVNGETRTDLATRSERNTMASKKKLAKKVAKGLVQDALRGTSLPEIGGSFALTGAQSFGPATSGLKPVGNDGPMNSVPGTNATLGAGESPYNIPAESAIDQTRKIVEKMMQKEAKKAAKKQAKNTLLAKTRKDPVGMLHELERLSTKLKPNHPLRLHAAGVALKAKLLAANANAEGGLAKSAVSLGSMDTTTSIANALQDVEAALGISESGAPFQPDKLDARAQLARIMGGGASESLAEHQNADALSAYGSPAASLGQMIKSDTKQALLKAEAEVKAAEASGDYRRISAANEQVSFEKLKAHHELHGGGN
jgi:hypothetical protein